MRVIFASIFATVVAVHDGDTLKVNLPCGIPVTCTGVPVRVAHVDAPELHGRCVEETTLAIRAKSIVTELYPVGSSILLENVRRDKYFRLLADVPAIQKALSDKALEHPYEGLNKRTWCKL